MNVVISIANYNSFDRIVGLLDSIMSCEKAESTDIIIINTGDEYKSNDKHCLDSYGCEIVQIASMKRMYASVMYLKVKHSEHLCGEDTVFMNLDDDYFLNKYAVSYAKKVFEENGHVNYLSLVKGLGMVYTDEELIKLSGQRFYRTGSCMGGAMIVRWREFYPMVTKFFEEYGVTEKFPGDAHNFDIPYWHFLLRENPTEYVYTLYDFSLAQHCNLGSNYLPEKGERGRLAHMYGDSFDPLLDPFTFNKD